MCIRDRGKIDEILSVRSDDRREVFEEAAGISKYRHRKEAVSYTPLDVYKRQM